MGNAMDTSSLKYFITAARTQNMSRAAEQLNITQPSLSASIKRLENEIGFRLFDRTKHGIVLNDYGRIYLKGVLEADAIMRNCMEEMEKIKKASLGLIRLSCSNSSKNSVLIDELLADGVNLRVSDIPHDWESYLLNKSCDLVITMGVLHRAQISSACLSLQKMVFAVGNGHPLAHAEGLSLTDLEACDFCSTDAPYSLLNVLKAQHPEYDFHPRIRFFGRNSADMLRVIRSGRFVGLMVKRNLPPDPGLHILDVRDFDISLPIYLYWRKADEANPALTHVRQKIQDFYSSLAE